MQRDDDRLLIYDIRQACGRILQYTEPGRDAFFADTQIQDAVIRNFEIIGEAAAKLSVEAKAALPEVDWRGPIGMRNALIHGYRDVQLEIVWQAVEQELPTLLEAAVRASGSTDLDG